jgi:hypothetical protein
VAESSTISCPEIGGERDLAVAQIRRGLGNARLEQQGRAQERKHKRRMTQHRSDHVARRQPLHGSDPHQRDLVKSELDAFLAASDADLAPLLQEALQSAVSAYEELKARAGRLDFLELLVKARTPILDVPAQSLRARARLNGNLELSRRINIVRHS